MACTSSPPVQPMASFPTSLLGRLVYHSYISYGDGSSHLFLLDFSTSSVCQIDQPSWGITDPMNAVFSPDGSKILFMGIKNNSWNIFTFKFGDSAPVNLTNSTGDHRNEDPKWIVDPATGIETGIVFKRDKDIWTMNTDGTSLVNLTNTALTYESSMPYFSPDLATLYFTRGAGKALRVYKKVGATITAVDPSNVAQYYPIFGGATNLVYARWNSNHAQLDQTVSYDGTSYTVLPTSDCKSDNSDAWPVDDQYLFFSGLQSSRVYRLFLGDRTTGYRWSLDAFGVNLDKTRNKLGSCYVDLKSFTTLVVR